MQEINALKALKNPAHGGTLGRLVDLIGHGLFGGSQSGAKQVLSQAIDQEAEYHEKIQGDYTLRLLDKNGGSQKQGIFEKTKSPFACNSRGYQ